MIKVNTMEVPKNLTEKDLNKLLVFILALLKKIQDKTDKLISSSKDEMKKLLSEVEFKKGDTGEIGKQGIQGKDGQDGKNGKDGKDGQDGKDGKNGTNGLNGQDANPTQIIAEASRIALDALKPLIPTISQIEQDLPILGQEIRNSLEILPEGEKLKIEAVENLRKELDDLEKKILAKTASFIGGGGVGKHNTEVYDLSDSLDGITTTFNLPAMYKVLRVESTSAPIVFRPNVDFTWTNTSVTFTSQIEPSTTLASGQTVLITYQV